MQWVTAIKTSIKWVLDYIFPLKCLSCNDLVSENFSVCPPCWAKLNFITQPFCKICGLPFSVAIYEASVCGKCAVTPPPYILARSLMSFDQESKNLIHSFKYYDKTHYAKFFARNLINNFGQEFLDIDIIVPVPMNRLKRLYRYYNPPQLLSKEISLLLNKPMIPDLLRKIKLTKSQSLLSKKQREKNLAGTIEINKKYHIPGRKILLIDDVRTTGITLAMCSNILRKNGANCVKVMTIAMT